MGLTLSEQIISQKVGRPVTAGALVVVEPDTAMGHDSLTPGIIYVPLVREFCMRCGREPLTRWAKCSLCLSGL